ncbi:hypothetical protein D3C81_1514540 [compost metagenome]
MHNLYCGRIFKIVSFRDHQSSYLLLVTACPSLNDAWSAFLQLLFERVHHPYCRYVSSETARAAAAAGTSLPEHVHMADLSCTERGSIDYLAVTYNPRSQSRSQGQQNHVFVPSCCPILPFSIQINPYIVINKNREIIKPLHLVNNMYMLPIRKIR